MNIEENRRSLIDIFPAGAGNKSKNGTNRALFDNLEKQNALSMTNPSLIPVKGHRRPRKAHSMKKYKHQDGESSALGELKNWNSEESSSKHNDNDGNGRSTKKKRIGARLILDSFKMLQDNQERFLDFEMENKLERNVSTLKNVNESLECIIGKISDYNTATSNVKETIPSIIAGALLSESEELNKASVTGDDTSTKDEELDLLREYDEMKSRRKEEKNRMIAKKEEYETLAALQKEKKRENQLLQESITERLLGERNELQHAMLDKKNMNEYFQRTANQLVKECLDM